MKLTYLGHSCFQLTIGETSLVFDPFIRGNELAAKACIQIDQVKADYILVSHGHDDHTADLVYLAKRNNATVVSSWELFSWLGKQGYTNAHPMNVGGRKVFDFGSVKMVYAAHSSSLADGTYAGVASGFVIEAEGKSIYFAGDTALTREMKLIGEEFRLDYALLPVGDNFTMDYKDACRAASFIGCDHIIAMHYDTFGLINVDHEKAMQHFSNNNKHLQFMPIGSETAL